VVTTALVRTLKGPVPPILISVGAVAALAFGFVGEEAADGGAGIASDLSKPIIAPASLEMYPSSTLTDWVAVADHVVTATVVSEKAVAAPHTESSPDRDFTGSSQSRV
jgi:hypothetical protein